MIFDIIIRYRFFFVALLVVMVCSIALAVALGRNSIDTVVFGSSDAQDYESLAHTMLSAHRFALTPDAVPEVFRTPGYPAFLMLLLGFFPLIIVPLVQMGLSALNAILVMLLGERFFTRGIGLVAAILYALEPGVIAYTLVGLSETLFIFLFLLATWCILDREPLKPQLLFGGLFLGAAILVRQIAFFIAPFFFLWLIWTYRSHLNRMLVSICILLLGMACFVAPWMIRNKIVAGELSLSSVGAFNLLMYNVAGFEEARTGQPLHEVIDGFYRELGITNLSLMRTFEYAHAENSLAKSYILAHPAAYAAYHLEKTIPFFLGSGFDSGLSILSLGHDDAQANISSLIYTGNIHGVLTAIINSPARPIEALFWLCITILSLIALPLSAMRDKEKLPVIVLLLIMIGAFAILTGPVSMPRYRLPVEPFLFLLATYVISLYLSSSSSSRVKALSQRIRS